MRDELVLTEYRVCANLPEKVTIGLVSDLHEQDAGEVLALLERVKPDLIVVAGDTFERRERDGGRWWRNRPLYERMLFTIFFVLDDLFGLVFRRQAHDTDNAYRFLREAGRIAPVYLSVGNHEESLLPDDERVIKERGAALLDNTDCEAPVCGMSVRIGGLSTDADIGWLDQFCGREGYKILLCHHPEYYEKYLRGRELDLVLSGHAHGGQIRVGGRGIYAPGQGLFPKYTKGFYEKKLIVTAGCSNTASVPRWGNPCEVVAVYLE